MRVAIAADHAGFEMKELLSRELADAGHAVTDLGTHTTDPVDYPDYAAAVGRAVTTGKVDRGIVVIGPALVREIALAFLGAEYTREERHARRLQKIEELERRFAGEG